MVILFIASGLVFGVWARVGRFVYLRLLLLAGITGVYVVLCLAVCTRSGRTNFVFSVCFSYSVGVQRFLCWVWFYIGIVVGLLICVGGWCGALFVLLLICLIDWWLGV